MTIFLVRHGESITNISDEAIRSIPDHMVPLTDTGRIKAQELGRYLREYFTANPPQNTLRLWCSPYLRTTQTMLLMREAMGNWPWDVSSRNQDIQFDERLREREWGAYKRVDYQDGGLVQQQHPYEYNHFMRTTMAPMGWYYARPINGESVADIITRLRSLFADIHYDCQRGITDHVIVTHAMTMKAFAFALTKAHPAHFDREKLIGNTGVRLLAKEPSTNLYADYGTIYELQNNIRLLTPPALPVTRHYTDIPELDYPPDKMNLLRFFLRD